MKAKLQHRILAETAEVIEKPPLEGKPLIAVNYWIYYWSNRWLPQEIPPWYEAVANAPSGAVFCWDQRFCLDPDFGLTLRTVYDWLNWRVIYESASLPGEDQPFAVVLQKTDAPAETE
jgi:hypothetical protein